MELTSRQEKIVEMVKECGPIAAEELAARLNLTRAAIRADLSVLTIIGHLEARPRVGYTYVGRKVLGQHLERLQQILVKEVQSVPVVIREGVSLYDAVVTTFLEDAGTLFVSDQVGHLVGAVSRSDLLRAAIGLVDLNKVPVGVIMTRTANLITLNAEDNVLSAARKLTLHKISALPVVKKSEAGDGVEVTGTVSLATIAGLVAEFVETH